MERDSLGGFIMFTKYHFRTSAWHIADMVTIVVLGVSVGGAHRGDR